MLDEKEIKIIRTKFINLIQSNQITKPKTNKKDFFKKKAESSLNLARELLERKDYFDWVINIAYYSMYYNAVCLLANNNIDLVNINETTHVITYQAIVFYFYIQKPIIEKQYLDDFKKSLNESNSRLQTIAKQRTNEVLSNFRSAKDERGKITYNLGKTAELKSAETAIRRAEAFDILTEKILISD